MCTGAALLYKVKRYFFLQMITECKLCYDRVIVGENKNFSSFAEKIMEDSSVEVELMQDDSCIEMMKTFIENNRNLWFEDIHEVE